MVSKAARRYANAYLYTAIEQDSLEEILEDVRLIRDTLQSSRELLLFLRSPVIKSSDKEQALSTIFSDKVQPLTDRFLKLTVEKNREGLIDQIVKGFIQSYNKHAGIIEVDVYSAMSITEDQQADLRKALETKTNKKVDVSYTENPDLMGGIAVRIEDTVIDGTVKHKISQLKSRFTEAAIE